MEKKDSVTTAFIQNFLIASGCEKDNADASVGLPYDCWHVDTDTLEKMLHYYAQLLVMKKDPQNLMPA